MKILIRDRAVCENCKHKTCAMSDVVERVLFTRFKTERYTCPVRYLQLEPADEQIDAGRIDCTISKGENASLQCIHCGLCALKCSHDNLEVVREGVDRFSSFLEAPCPQNAGADNILATSFLHVLFEFSANTNLNKALLFDGIVSDNQGRCAFVAVDKENDSLESCRRLLGDIVQHNFENPKNKITAGLMVLRTIPRAGNRDVITLVERLAKFPRTSMIDMYVVTFEILRELALKFGESRFKFGDLLFNVSKERFEEYVARMRKLDIVIND